MLVHTFIITPKLPYREALMMTSDSQTCFMAALIPEIYRPLFKRIVKESINDIMDTRDHQKAYATMAEAMLTGYGELWYPSKGTEPLQDVIRRTFYDTLLILRNDYNPYTFDQFIVVLSSEIISEQEWEMSRHPQKTNVVTGNFRKMEAR